MGKLIQKEHSLYKGRKVFCAVFMVFPPTWSRTDIPPEAREMTAWYGHAFIALEGGKSAKDCSEINPAGHHGPLRESGERNVREENSDLMKNSYYEILSRITEKGLDLCQVFGVF